MGLLRTGELARLANVNVETLRFYERQGLLPEPPRRQSGYRAYPAEAVDLVRFIRRAQQLGFSLREIKELLALREASQATCGDVAALARGKIMEIEAKITDLRAMQLALSGLLCGCAGGSTPIAECPIIQSLACERHAETSKPPSKRRKEG